MTPTDFFRAMAIGLTMLAMTVCWPVKAKEIET